MPDQESQKTFDGVAMENEVGNRPAIADTFRTVPNGSESFGNVRKDSETFGTIPKSAEAFRSVPKLAERKENHTVTVREAAKLFESAGVARTERTIVNWCQPNKLGIARLDCYFDPNERKYYLTHESIDRAIEEEKSRAARLASESETVPKDSETKRSGGMNDSAEQRHRVQELEREVVNLKIANQVKDQFITQLQTEREGFFDKLLQASRKIGELETKLLQLQPPMSDSH